MRDLGRAEPWQQSLERSLARRGKLPRRSIELTEAQPERRAQRSRSVPGARPEPHAHRSRSVPPYWRLCWRELSKRPRMLAVSTWSVASVATLAVVFPAALAERGAHRVATVPPAAHRAATAPPASGLRVPADSRPAHSGGIAPGSASGTVAAPRTCRPVAASAGYINPLARAVVTPERIDQGVDYAGRGTLVAIGTGRVTYLARSGSGWPGAFIEYRLFASPDAGCYVYYAEGVSPSAGLHVGETVSAGQPIARIIPGWSTGIEIGWAAGINTKTYAARTGDWSARDDADNVASEAGKSFSAMIASLGGPSGKVEH